MSRICSSRRLNSRPFFSVASVRMEKWAELIRIHLGSELRVDPTKGLENAKHKTAERIHLGWKEMLAMFDRAEEDSGCKGCYHAASTNHVGADEDICPLRGLCNPREPFRRPLRALRHNRVLVGFQSFQ